MTTPSPSKEDVTQLLVAWGNGNQAALDKLMPLVHEELRRLAHYYMRRERPGQTLQTSALVDEAYLRLIDQKNVHWQNRAHFFAISAQLMRRILRSPRTVMREWSMAKAWLYRTLSNEA